MQSAPPELTPVKSSHVQALGYDKQRQEMYVLFKNGDYLRYPGISEAIYGTILGSPSVGGSIHEHVRGKFNFECVRKGIG